MAERVVSTLKGKVKFEMDKSSLSNIKKEIKKLKDDLKGIQGGMVGGGGSSSRSPRKSSRDFEKYKKEQIEFFRISKTGVKGVNKELLEGHIAQIQQAKTREELVYLLRRERGILQKNLRQDKLRNKELEKQSVIRRRITSSTEQMVGALGSAFVAVEALGSVINTGMQLESFEKTFIAVSDNADLAKEHMAFARSEADRLGVSIVESGKAYSRMLGAAGTNTPVEQVKESFTAISEAAIALGLSADDQMGAYRAMSQILSKQKFMAEEIRSQLADRGIPAMKILTEAAKEAGLAVDKIGIDKLMEQGKLTTDIILPHFSKGLRDLANNGDALATALRENFQPALGRATNTFKDLQNNVFQGGFKQSLMFVLNTFTDFGKESKDLARTLGTVLGGAVLGLTFPFGLLWAAILDVQKALEDTFGLRMEQDVLKMTAAVIGMTVSFAVLYKILKMVVKSMGALIAAKKALGSLAGKVTGGGSDKKASTLKTKAASAAIGASLGAPAAAVIGTGLVLGGASNLFGQTDFAQENTKAIIKDLQTRASRFEGSKMMQRVQVDVNLNQNAKEFIDARVNDGLQQEYDSVYNTGGSSKD